MSERQKRSFYPKTALGRFRWITAGIALLIALVYLFILFIPVRTVSKCVVEISPGMNPATIALRLKESGVISNVRTFVWGVRLMSATRRLQAGHFMFQGKLNHYRVIQALAQGKVMTFTLTFPEGVRMTRIAHILEEATQTDSKTFIALSNDPRFCEALGVESKSLEGYLFPDTYHFPSYSKPEEILGMMVRHMQKVFSDSLLDRARHLGLSMHQVLTIASIIEGEAVLDEERPAISALYHNRLKNRMLLQADPTIQYIIKGGPRRLLNKDLQIDSPYNTYLFPGLPPGPVNNPGMASILAALYPADKDYLYMVANGDGSHTFSKSIEDHLAAKRRFDRIRKKTRSG